MFRNLLFIVLLFASTTTIAQTDTFRITTYNLLHYGRPQANRYALKNTYLQPILATIKPTIIGFNEIDTTFHSILDTLNTVMPYAMEHGGVHNTTNTDILDGLFWKSGKFKWIRDTIICNYIRDIVAYDLYYDDPLLGTTHDTVKIKVITAHFKSSDAVADRVARDTETRRVMRYLDHLTDTINMVILGDFNLYKSSENAYQNLIATTNALTRFNDPANRPGKWDGNDTFAVVHTQSPRLVQLSDQGASGGLDSRFDFVLLSSAMMNGWKGMKYIPNTYTSFGNDGLHYNKALTDAPTHSVLPTSIIQALYSCSDHLPVYADVAITPPLLLVPNSVSQLQHIRGQLSFQNPFGSTIYYQLNDAANAYSYKLVSMQGAVIQSGLLTAQAHEISINNDLATGLYFIQIADNNGQVAVWKLVRQ